jgi:hypothetical protein
MPLRRNSLRALILASALLVSACAEPETGEPTALSPLSPPAQLVTQHTLLECPTSQAWASQGTVGLLGGTLDLLGTLKVHVPLGAVPVLTRFDVAIPASRHMEVAVSAAGLAHYLFQVPVTVTIDYSRCPASVLEKGPITVYHIDEQSKALLEHMGGVDDRANRRITFTTDHLSGYAIAN